MFTCLNQLIMVPHTDQQAFLNAVMVLSDYLRTYGETIFQIVSRERRVAIEKDYEVEVPASQRYQFLRNK